MQMRSIRLFKNIIDKKIFILFTFLFVIGTKFFYSLIFTAESNRLKLLRFISLAFLLILSFFSLRNNRVVTILLAILILISGIGSLSISFFVGLDQLSLKLIFILIGAYFVYGGVRLIIMERVSVKERIS